MKVLVAEDDRSLRVTMQKLLEGFGYEVCAASDGNEALNMFLVQRPPIIVTDWMMPGMDGLTMVKTIRAFAEDDYTYIIMVSSREDRSDIMEGMQAGVDEFLTKPVDRDHLHARLRVGRRILMLQDTLRQRIREIEEAQKHVRRLQGFLPICAYCKNIRNEADLWQEVEEYIVEHESSIEFSHSICPECYEKFVKPMEEKMRAQKEAAG
jgi:sigma-B regulation protein RsbU (phosphoserine phosphatase)